LLIIDRRKLLEQKNAVKYFQIIINFKNKQESQLTSGVKKYLKDN